MKNWDEFVIEQVRRQQAGRADYSHWFMPQTSLDFKSQNGKRYSINHVPEHPKGPFLNLCGHDKDKEDFVKVARDVLKITHGRPERLDGAYLELFYRFMLNSDRPLADRLLTKVLDIPYTSPEDRFMVASIEVPRGFTEIRLYNFAQGYKEKFTEVEFDEGLKALIKDWDRYNESKAVVVG